jgi:hypothetical protein
MEQSKKNISKKSRRIKMSNEKNEVESQKMEIVILEPNTFIEKIKFNFEEIKLKLEERISKYTSLVYNDAQILLAKKDRAELNKLKSEIETKRKEIKAKCLQPYEAFEIKVKELVALVEKPINEIDKQVKSYEEIQKEDKRKILIDFYKEKAGSLLTIIPFEKIFNEKWLNQTVKLQTAKDEMLSQINLINNAFTIIDDLKTEYSTQVKDKFIQTLDLQLALSENKRLTEQAEKLRQMEEEKKKAEEEKNKIQEVANLETVLESPVIIEEPKQVEKVEEPTASMDDIFDSKPKEEYKQYNVRISATDLQIILLNKFLAENRIDYDYVK